MFYIQFDGITFNIKSQDSLILHQIQICRFPSLKSYNHINFPTALPIEPAEEINCFISLPDFI